jgi:hypothetical protein
VPSVEDRVASTTIIPPDSTARAPRTPIPHPPDHEEPIPRSCYASTILRERKSHALPAKIFTPSFPCQVTKVNHNSYDGESHSLQTKHRRVMKQSMKSKQRKKTGRVWSFGNLGACFTQDFALYICTYPAHKYHCIHEFYKEQRDSLTNIFLTYYFFTP